MSGPRPQSGNHGQISEESDDHLQRSAGLHRGIGMKKELEGWRAVRAGKSAGGGGGRGGFQPAEGKGQTASGEEVEGSQPASLVGTATLGEGLAQTFYYLAGAQFKLAAPEDNLEGVQSNSTAR